MLRTHHNGELRMTHLNQEVKLCGWVSRIRDKGGMVWIDLRDRYGITQLMFDESRTSKTILDQVRSLGREYVIAASGTVIERVAKNDKISTGEIEVL